MGAVAFITKPTFQFTKGDRPTSYDCFSLSPPAIEGDGLATLVESYRLDPVLIAKLRRVSEFSQALEYTITSPAAKLIPVTYVEDTYDVQYSMLDYTAATCCATDKQCLEEAIRLAVLIYIQETLQELLVGCGTANLVHRLREPLTAIFEHHKYALLILWTLFMGGMSSKRTLDRVWHMVHLANMVPKSWTWDVIKGVLKRILWIEQVHEARCKAPWEEIEITRTVNITFMP
jgi:hypothetical protein